MAVGATGPWEEGGAGPVEGEREEVRAVRWVKDMSLSIMKSESARGKRVRGGEERTAP